MTRVKTKMGLNISKNKQPLSSSFVNAYYVEDNPLLSDGSFDRLATRLSEKFDEVEHQHKEFIDKDTVNAGTYLGEYPTRIPEVIKQMRREYGK